MKHAYLIIAHNEFEILKILISLLDDKRNDIYIHFDKKINNLPHLLCENAKLVILNDRIDARWGDYSLVEVELTLMDVAYNNGDYDYYHLISGVDLPIKSQDFIHNYCEIHKGKEFIGFAPTSKAELNWRCQHYFIFSRLYKSNNMLIRIFRLLFIKIQDLVKYRRTNIEVRKGSQWCSITQNFVEHILLNRKKIKHLFNHTYCPDEMFIQTLCWNSELINNVFNVKDEFAGCKRYIKWSDGELKELEKDDIIAFKNSESWFARKFSSENYSLIEMYKNDFIS